MYRWYLSALGSTCYDESGITYPVEVSVDFRKILKRHGATNIRFVNQFGWHNQPKVLTFNLPPETFLRPKHLRAELPDNIAVMPHWYNSRQEVS